MLYRFKAERFVCGDSSHQKLICVANRLPTTAFRSEDGNWEMKKSSGGLVSALSAVDNLHMTMVGWPGADVPPDDREGVTAELKSHSCIPVYLSHDEIELYYNGFCNGVVWPLFHYVTPALITGSTEMEWNMYVQVNREFAKAIADILHDQNDGDALVWIHDYHLMLVPRLLRELVPNANIGFFLHTPFPSPELFRMLPYREEVLHGLLSSNYIALQVPDYCRHFLASCSQLTNLQVTAYGVDAVPIGGALVYCGAVPIGIDPVPFIQASTQQEWIKEKAAQIQEQMGNNRRIILGVDRLDYMKGIQHKLQAYEEFLNNHPEWVGNCVLVQLAVPSRADVKEYQRLKKHVHELVGQLCGKHSHLLSGPPVLYLDQAIDFQGLVALYRAADVMLITSIRDGMNLVAFEYIASQEGSNGVLVLSEFAGAMQSMGGGAVRVNPWNMEETSEAIHRALTMDEKERRSRHEFCFDYVTTHTAQKWASTFLENLKSAVTETDALKASIPPILQSEDLLTAWELSAGNRRMLVMDLVDCLVPSMTSAGLPLIAHPYLGCLSRDVKAALETLLFGEDSDVVVMVVSPHRREVMESVFSWLEGRNCALILAPENGSVLRCFDSMSTGQWISVFPREGEEWVSSFKSVEWRRSLRKLIDFFQERTPGSYVEESEFSLKWFTDMRPHAESTDSTSSWRDLLVQRWAGPLSDSDAEVVLADRYVEIRPKGSSIVDNIGKVITHSEVFGLLRDPVAVCVVAGSFPYRDDDIYQMFEEKLSTMWVHQCQSPRSPTILQSIPSAASPLYKAGEVSSRSYPAELSDETPASSGGGISQGIVPRVPTVSDWEPSDPGAPSNSAAALGVPGVKGEYVGLLPPLSSVITPRSRSSQLTLSSSPFMHSCEFFSITVSHAKISKAKYSLPTQYQMSRLLKSMAERTFPNMQRSRGA